MVADHANARRHLPQRLPACGCEHREVPEPDQQEEAGSGRDRQHRDTRERQFTPAECDRDDP
jgi:hypothetical protein